MLLICLLLVVVGVVVYLVVSWLIACSLCDGSVMLCGDCDGRMIVKGSDDWSPESNAACLLGTLDILVISGSWCGSDGARICIVQ
jgi:hypothetical protein